MIISDDSKQTQVGGLWLTVIPFSCSFRRLRRLHPFFRGPSCSISLFLLPLLIQKPATQTKLWPSLNFDSPYAPSPFLPRQVGLCDLWLASSPWPRPREPKMFVCKTQPFCSSLQPRCSTCGSQRPLLRRVQVKCLSEESDCFKT